MRNCWMKGLTAWLLAALLAVSPALAEVYEVQEVLMEPMQETEQASSEDGLLDLPEEISETSDAPTEEPAAPSEGEGEDGNKEAGEIEPAGTPAVESTYAPTESSGEEPKGEPGEESDEEPKRESDEEQGEATKGESNEESTEKPEGESDEEQGEEAKGETEGESTGESDETPKGEPGEESDEEPKGESDEKQGEEAKGESDGESAEKPEGESDEEPGEESNEESDGKPAEEPTEAPPSEAQVTATATPEVVQAEETPAPKLEAAGPVLALSHSELNLGIKEKYTLTVASLPEGAAGAVFQSSDPGVAEVDAQSGLITARAIGSAVITATAGEAQASCAVNVLSAPRKVSLSRKKVTLGVGQAYTITALLPAGTASQMKWKSSKSSVATVDADGNITARGRGTAKITGYTFNGKKAACKVVVKPAPSWMSAGLDTAVMSVGMRRTVSVTLSKGSKAGITVTSSDPNVVSTEGRDVAALNPGAVTLVVETHNGLRQEIGLNVVPAPGAVSFPEAEVLMGKGEKRVLTPIYDNDGTADLTWTSSSPKTVSVSKAGKLKAKRQGSALITLTTHNGLSASCMVKVYKAPSKVTIQPGKKLSLGVGEPYQMGAKLPKGTYSALTWVSSAPGVAAVDASGQVTALAPGTTKITVKTFNGKKAACKLTVQAAPSAVAFSVGNQTLGVGMKADLKPVVNPGAAANIVLTSDNPGVASVSGGTVTALAPGSAVITASTYNGLTAALEVTVLPAPGTVGLAFANLHLGVGETIALAPIIDPGTAADFTFKSGNKKIATVNARGVVKGKKQGTTTVAVTTHNGLKARVKVKVYKAPSKVKLKPAALAMESGDTYQLSVTLPKGSASAITFTSSNPDVAAVDAAGVVYAGQPGSATVTATTYNNKKAVCQVDVASGLAGTAGVTGAVLTLSSSGMVMMRVGAKWQLSAASSAGNLDGIQWTTTSASIARVSASGGDCAVTGAGPGTSIVTARLPDGASASVIFMVVDVTDLSASNFNNVQKALLAHEDLINSTAGGNVIWDMISAKLLKGNYKQSNVNSIIATLKAANPTYRNLYIYSFGTYNFTAEANVAGSNFNPESNTLYLKKSSEYESTETYEYVVFHESGHAIDYNADGNGELNSLNAAAVSALRTDVSNLLYDLMGTAIAKAGVSAASVDTAKVVQAMLDWRTLSNRDGVIAELGMSDSDVKVYEQLKLAVAGEINPTVPHNNGSMVWDAVEGATNFDVSLVFGHAYLVKETTKYGSAGYTYFYDARGNPKITSEPWAEFFSSNVMGDSNTISKNLAYLPETCKYFADTLVPQMLNYFTNRLKSL